MANFDVFNGDADGIISLVQLRRAEPREATLVTGRKRDIVLLGRVKAGQGDNVTVLDISMRSNADDLRRILKAGANVFYADHHNAGDIPDHPNLQTVIDTSPEICTAMLIDSCLEGAYRAWAVTATFGDSFPKLARKKAAGLKLPLEKLERLGMLVNYNGYGGTVADLHYHPADLFRCLAGYDTPMEFLADKQDVFNTLDAGYEDDLIMAKNSKIIDRSDVGLVIVLEDNAASRRISGVFGNQLAQDNPERAHAILTAQKGGYLVSIRAPLSERSGADALALKFETGGGRAAAAGINHLPTGDFDRFIEAFRAGF
jgi:nanoRNase/pAp phosphatase (c-di-AMP/oligoRNAs hydrolase)